MANHFDYTDEEFVELFRSARIDPACFTHEAHLRLAFMLIRYHGLEKATAMLCQQIAHFDQVFGDGTKFHKTLTVAAANTVFHFMQRSSTSSFRDLLSAFPRLRTNFKSLLDQHYSFDVLQHPQAKTSYLQPDLLPFE